MGAVVSYEEELGPGEVKEYGIDWDLQDGETITQSEWSSDDLSIADGSTVVTTEAGDITPPAPDESTSGTYPRTRAWVYNGVLGTDHKLKNTIRTPLRVYEAVLVIPCRERKKRGV